MSEPNKILVPELRFSEFRDVGEWQEHVLGNICTNISSGKDKSDFNGSYELYGSTGVIGKTSSDSYDGTFILVARVGANAGLLTRANGKFGVTDNTLVLFLNNSENIDFIFHTLDRFGLNQMVFGSGQPLITGGQLKAFSIKLPTPAEQQKIADCLSTIDELIAAQTNKIAALKDHKKGLMQQLFPAEGETVPKLRFPELQDAGEWDQDKLENLINTVIPPQKLPTALYQAEGQFPIIDQSQSYICGWTNNQDALIVDDLPLIIFGDHTCALKIVNLPFAQGADGIKILKTKERVETNYLYQYLQFNPVVMEEYKRHFSILKEKMISFPKIETGEQQKIADCLSSIDELITAQTQKIAALKTHKKGLMQQLFPVADKVIV